MHRRSRGSQGCGSSTHAGRSAPFSSSTGRSSIATSNLVRVSIQAPDSKSIFAIVIFTFFPVRSERALAMVSSTVLTACIFKE
ncbi:hypothetical protein D3C71_567720 [compost metagenome]